jgi:hypothetical protein
MGSESGVKGNMSLHAKSSKNSAKSTKKLNIVETPSLLAPFFERIMSIDNVLALLMLLMVTIQTICHAVHLAVRHRRVNRELDP